LNWPVTVAGRFDVLIAVLVGGCAGGLSRFAIVRAWPTGSSGFPWSTLLVNLGGAAALGVLVVLAGSVWRSRYARPLLGTGFCGAFTTFSAVVVDADRLLGRGEAAVAVCYLAASFVGGLVIALVAVMGTRALIGGRDASLDPREEPIA
jgi:CrcB protein